MIFVVHAFSVIAAPIHPLGTVSYDSRCKDKY